MISIDQLKQKKRTLDEKRTSLIAEEKFLNSERARLDAKLKELGLSSIEDAKQVLSHLERSIEEKQVELDKLLSILENSSVSVKPFDHNNAVQSALLGEVVEEPEEKPLSNPSYVSIDLL